MDFLVSDGAARGAVDQPVAQGVQRRQALALFWGLHLAIGLGVGLTHSLLPLLALVILVQRSWRRALLGLLVMSLACLYGAQLRSQQPREGDVAGRLHIERVSRMRRGIAQGWLLRGRLDRLRVRVYLKGSWERPPADRDYWVEGQLDQGALTVDPRTPWIPVRGSWSGAEWRLQARQWIGSRIARSVKDRRGGLFLTALLAGDLEDTTLLFGFARLGLLHLMAISGFHFSIVAMVAGFLVRFWTRLRVAAFLLIAILTFYLAVVGSAPSVLRAWVMAVALFAGWIGERPHSSLNALGVALCAVLLWDPYALLGLGFQYSFLCTVAILLYFGPISRWLRSYSLGEVAMMSRLDQCGAIVLSMLRRMVALTISVHLVALPLTLFVFHRFPLISLLVNLCFPFALAGVMALSLLGLAVPSLLTVAGELARGSLCLVESIPVSCDYMVRVPPFSSWLLLTYLVALLGVPMLPYLQCPSGNCKERRLHQVLR